MYFFLIVVLNCWLNANLSLNLPRSTCDERKPSVHEDRDSAVAKENPYSPVRGHCTAVLSTVLLDCHPLHKSVPLTLHINKGLLVSLIHT
jgi:hypothetical protein